MAVTKIWSIKKTLDKAMKYILNPIKAKYVYSYACAPETADLEFELTLDQNSHSGGIIKLIILFNRLNLRKLPQNKHMKSANNYWNNT